MEDTQFIYWNPSDISNLNIKFLDNTLHLWNQIYDRIPDDADEKYKLIHILFKLAFQKRDEFMDVFENEYNILFDIQYHYYDSKKYQIWE